LAHIGASYHLSVILKNRELTGLLEGLFMETKNVGLAALKIDRSSEGILGKSRKFRSFRKIALWLVVIGVLAASILYLKDLLNPPVEVQLATVSLTSPAQANAVLTASGYVVARRKAAVASKGNRHVGFFGCRRGG
jgi:hypothetical protein